MDDSQIDIVAQRCAVETTLSFLVALCARDDPALVDRLHERLTGHMGNAAAKVAGEIADHAAVLVRFDAVACAALDRIFATAKGIS